MTVTTSVPSPTALRPGRLVGLVIAVATVTAAVISLVISVLVDTGSEEAQPIAPVVAEVSAAVAPTERAWSEGLSSLTPEELGWAYRTGIRAGPGVYPGTGMVPGPAGQPNAERSDALSAEELAWVNGSAAPLGAALSAEELAWLKG